MDKTYYSFDLIFESNKIKNRFKYSSLDILIDIMNSFQHPGIRRSFASMLGEMYDIVKFFDGLFEEIFKDKSAFDEYSNQLKSIIVPKIQNYSAVLLFKRGYSFYDWYDHLYWERTQKLVKDLWKSMPGGEPVVGAEKGFRDLFDDFHDNVIEKYPKKFVKSLKNIGTMYRARSWDLSENYELMITPAEHAKENRWNPDGVAFMYLACGKREDKFDEIINLPQKTCFEEIRLENGSEVIICEFKPIIKNAKLINLYYEDENPSEIARNFYELPKEIKERGINSLLNDDKFILKMNEMVKKSKNKSDFEDKSKEEILYAIRNLGINDQIFKVANERLGRLFLTIIDKTIFETVDKMEDPELKAYIPFRFFSNYLIEKGYDGIIYRSTRMNKIGLSGKNVVLFDNSYATYQLGSMKKFLRKDGRYIELKFD